MEKTLENINLQARQERFSGCLLGVGIGDALGAPVEGLNRQEIMVRHGRVDDFLPGAHWPGRTTDDTQMTLALARSLVRCRGIVAADCARAYAEAYDPQRGYGRSAHLVLQALREGADFGKTGTFLFPEGSFGNGAAMRIASIGLIYGGRPLAELRDLVWRAVCCTHTHPEAVSAAILLARLVGIMAGIPAGNPPEVSRVLVDLRSYCEEPEMLLALDRVSCLLDEGAEADRIVAQLGCGVRSRESVAAALLLSLKHLSEPEEALVCAVGLGGDTDTLASMVGAVLGALHGPGGFPERWVSGLEPGQDGREGLLAVAAELAALEISNNHCPAEDCNLPGDGIHFPLFPGCYRGWT